MITLIITSIILIAITIIALSFIAHYFNSKKPENNCKHQYTEPTIIFDGSASTQYCRSCKICGKRDVYYGSSYYD